MKKLFLFFLLSILFFASFSSAANNNFIIIRANVNPMYIEGESVQIQAFILVFRSNKPTDESATLHIEIIGKNIEYNHKEEFTIHGGRIKTYSMPALKEGYYKVIIFATKAGLSSQKILFEFGVTKAPVPYSAYFTNNGKKFYFKSLRINETGEIDPNYPFTLKIYSWTPPNEATLIRTIKNATEITVSIPSSIRKSNGIIIVDIIDKYGWKNSATMDLSSFLFTGIPKMYDYGYRYREPLSSTNIFYIITGIIIIIGLLVLYWKFMRG